MEGITAYFDTKSETQLPISILKENMKTFIFATALILCLYASSAAAGGEIPVNANFGGYGGYGGKRSADAQKRCYIEHNQECYDAPREECFNNGPCEIHFVQVCQNIPREVCSQY